MAAKLEWVSCSNGKVPENPVIVGVDKGRITYVIRVHTELGRAQWTERGFPDDGLTDQPTFMWNEELSPLKEYEVLTAPGGSGYYWGPRRTSHAPFSGGSDIHGPLYITRTWYQGRYYCGFGSDELLDKKDRPMKYSHKGQIEFKSEYDVLNPIPSSMLKGRDEERTHCCYVFGWTPLNYILNVHEEFLASAACSSNERSVIAKVVDADGELTFDNVLLTTTKGNKDSDEAKSTVSHGLTGGDQHVEVLLAGPGAYCWGAPGTDILGEFSYPIGRVLYNGSYHVGRESKGSCYIRKIGETIMYDRFFVGTAVEQSTPTEDTLLSAGNWLAPELGWAPAEQGGHLLNSGIRVDLEQEQPVLVARSWTSAGHRIQGKESSKLVGTKPSCYPSMFEVLLGRSEHLEWVRDKKGYVPAGAVIGGISHDGGYVYIGRVVIGGAVNVGTILPSRKICTVTVMNGGDTRDYESYEVLVDTRTTNAVTPTPSKDSIIVELKNLQRDFFLKNWNNDVLSTVVNEDSERLVHDRFLTLLSISNVEVFQGDDEPEWIPYVGRLARMYQFPQAFQTFLFKLIEFYGVDKFSQRARQRLASILKYGAKAGIQLLSGCENGSIFGPILSHLAEESCRLDEHSITEILQTILVTLEHQKNSTEDLLRTCIIPSSWGPLLEGCIAKANPLQRPELVRRFKAQGIFSKSVTHRPDQSASRSADETAAAKLKLKSLSIPGRLGSLTYPAHFVHVQVLEVQNVRTENLSEMPVIPDFDYIHNFDEFIASATDKETPTVVTANEAWENALADSATPNTFHALTRSLLALELPLDSEKLRMLIDKGAGEDQRVAITWTLLASLSNHNHGAEILLREDVMSELAHFLIQVAQTCSSQVTVEAIFATLHAYCLSSNYSEKDYKALRQLLASTIILPNAEGSLQRILLFLCSLSNPAAFDSAMIKEVWDVLERSKSDSIRILSTRHISIAASEHEQPLGIQQLESLANLTQDSVRDVRVYSRVAFSNGLLNNPSLHLDERMIELIAKVFAMHPVQLTIAGGLPEDYTYKINRPLLTVIEKLSKLPRAVINKFCKFIGNLAGNQTQPTKYLRVMVQQIVELLLRGQVKLLPGTVEAVEKLILADNNASKGEDYGTCLLEFLAKCVELKLISKNYTGSEKLLQKIVAKMKLEMHEVYAIALHMFTTIQELPDRIFRMYHFQMAALGLSSNHKPDNSSPLRRFLLDHALLSDTKNDEDEELLRSIQAHLQRGARPSALTTQILINSLESSIDAGDIVEVLEELVSSGNGCLTESQMEVVCRVKLDPYGRRIWDSLLHGSLLQHQQLSRALVQQMLDDLESRTAGADTLIPVGLALENPVASRSLQIVQQVLRIALKRISAPTALKPMMSPIEKVRIKMREESTMREALNLLFQALKSIQRMNQHLCPELAEKVKLVILSPKKCYLHDTLITDTDLLIQLHAVSSLSITINEISQILDNDGPACIFRKSEGTLQLLYTMLLTRINEIEKNQPAHVLVNILGVLLGDTDDIIIASACEYIENYCSSKYKSLVQRDPGLEWEDDARAAEDNFLLHLRFSIPLQNVLRRRSEVYSKQINQAIELAASGRRHEDLRHLEDVSKAVFSSWLNATTLSAKHGNALILRCLCKNDRLKMDAKTQEILDLIMCVEGSSPLAPAHAPLTAPSASSDVIIARPMADEDVAPVPLEKITQAMAQLFIKRGMDDLQRQALILGRAIDLFKLLQRHGRHNLWDGLVQLVMTQDGASRSMIALLSQTPLHSLFQTLNEFLAQLSPHAFRHTLSSKPQEDILGRAFIWQIASIVHDKVKVKCEFNRSPSIVIASELLDASGGRATEALSLLTSIAHIENHHELETLISLLADCNKETGQTYPDWYSSEYEHLSSPQSVRKITVEKTMIKLTLGYVMARFPTSFGTEKLNSIALDLYGLLQRAVCSYKHFLKLGSKSTKFSYQDLARLFRMLRDYNVKGLPNDAYEELLSTMDSDSGQDERYHMLPFLLNNEISEGGHEGTKKSAPEFVNALREQNPCLANTDPKVLLDVLEKAQTNIQTMQDSSAIKAWAARVRKEKSTNTDPLEFISVVQRAFELLRGWTLTTVQIFSIYLAIADDGNCRLFQQVSTGLGKSLIIAVVAVKKALEGHLVDIYTSNAHLASRDSNDWSDFFAIFGLTCDHNGEEEGRPAYVGGEKACYEKHMDIVYGDIRQFEFDALRNDYLSLETRGERAYGFAIVDEVDSCYLDDAAKLTILSAPIAGMELLQPLYHKIWKFLLRLDSRTNILQVDSSYFTFEGKFVCQSGKQFYISPSGSHFISEDDIKAAARDGKLKRLSSWKIYERRSYIKTRLENYIKNLITGVSEGIQQPEFDDLLAERIKIPLHLKKFVSSQTIHWAEAAIVAHTLRELKDYVIVSGLVAPIDPSNGATQSKSSWSNGVQQFLQIKHSLNFTAETLMTAFMSHRSMLEKYENGLLGITGTLGNAATSAFLNGLQIKTLQIPDPYNNNRLRVFPVVELATNKSDWMLKIKEATEKELKGDRAVLVICSTIRSANSMREDLTNRISEHNGVHLYARSDSEETSDEEFRNIRAESRSVYITTLLGARGMDIRPVGADDVGGIHVILTFLVPNGRVEKQAFGRAARQGSFGSVQYILKAPKGPTVTPTTSAGVSVRMNAAEDEQLGLLEKQIYPAICAKDEAFEGLNSSKHCLN